MTVAAQAHSCDAPKNAPEDGYGVAVESCDADANGVLWVGNGEYGSAVQFCPYCGFKGAPMPNDLNYKFAKEPS